MVTTVRSLGLNGIAGYEVTTECFLSGGLPAFDIVGLPSINTFGKRVIPTTIPLTIIRPPIAESIG